MHAAIVCVVFRAWLPAFHQPERGGPERPVRAGDLTPLFSVWTQVTERSIFQRGELPLWSDHIHCGEPFFAKPQIGALSPTTLLSAVLPGQVVATWTFLVHLWIAGMAMYAWGLDLLGRDAFATASAALGERDLSPARCTAAACGGVAFMLSGIMAEHAMIGHGPIVLVACWTPLVLRAVSRALVGVRAARSTLLAGVLVAVQILAGGETMFLYNVIAGAILTLAWLLLPSHADRAGEPAAAEPGLVWRATRAVSVAAVIGVVSFGLSAVKLLPGLELMPFSNRAGGLLPEDAAAPIVEIAEPAVLRFLFLGEREPFGPTGLVRSLFIVTSIVALSGLVSGLGCRSLRWIVASAAMMVAAGVAIAHVPQAFALLWHALPMFHYQRIPQRALVLAYLGVGVLVMLGAHALLSSRWLGDARVDTKGALADAPARGRTWMAGSLLAIALFAESWLALPRLPADRQEFDTLLRSAIASRAAVPPLPPAADIRQEVRANPILNHLARQPGEFRIHAMESVDRNWGIEHVTVPLGLSNLAGWDHLWLLEYLGAEGAAGRDVLPFLAASYRNGGRHAARFWGMMNVRYVTAMRPTEMPGLRFVAEFPPCAICQPAKSAGPLLYENTLCMPRAWLARSAVLVLGERAERQEAAYRLMAHAGFDPREVVLVHGERSLAETGEPAPFHGVVAPRRWIADAAPHVQSRDRRLVTYDARDPAFWTQPDAVDSLLMDAAESVASSAAGDSAAADPEAVQRRQNSVRLRLPARTGHLVLAEKFAHFPGWRVHTDRGPRELVKANGVASAVALDGSERWIELTYRPTSFVAGAAISAVTAVLVVIALASSSRLPRSATGRPEEEGRTR